MLESSIMAFMALEFIQLKVAQVGILGHAYFNGFEEES